MGCPHRLKTALINEKTKLSSQSQPLPNPQPFNVEPVKPSSDDLPRTLKFTLSLGSPQDLRVQKDDFVQKGQVIAEQRSAKRDLLGRRQQLKRLLSLYAQQKHRPVLKSRSTKSEEAQVQAAKQQVDDAIAALRDFQSSSPWTESAQQLLPLKQEERQLARLEARYQKAQRTLTVADGKLRAAKERAKSSRDESIGTAQKDQLLAAMTQADLVAQIESLNRQLEHEGIVRSPYSGTVRSLKWEEQSDQTLTVSLTLSVNRDTAETSKAPDLVELEESAEQFTELSIPSKEWSVLSIYDGDTLRVTDGTTTEKIRFACIDAPELKQSMGTESRDFLRALIAQNGDRVRLNVVDTDRYGRKVAEVFTGNQLVQRRQVEAGMAHVYRKYISNCSYGNELIEVEAIASSNGAGVWAGEHVKPWDFRKKS